VLAREGSARIGVEDLHDDMRVGVFMVLCVCIHDMCGCICVCIHMCVHICVAIGCGHHSLWLLCMCVLA